MQRWTRGHRLRGGEFLRQLGRHGDLRGSDRNFLPQLRRHGGLGLRDRDFLREVRRHANVARDETLDIVRQGAVLEACPRDRWALKIGRQIDHYAAAFCRHLAIFNNPRVVFAK